MVKRKRSSIPNFADASSSLASHLISAEAKDDNLVFSPLSIHIVLGLVASGSGGPTRDQLLGYFKSDSVEELNKLLSHHATILLYNGRMFGGPHLSTANGVWIDRSFPLKPDFKGIVRNEYEAACKYADFQTEAEQVRTKVNAWVTKKTNGLINDLLPPDSVDSLTNLIFANAIYFKGIWEKKFESSLTKYHKFYLLNGTSVQVPFMTSDKKQLIRNFDDFKVLSLPYQQGTDRRRFSMHIFLPHAKDGLPSLIEKFGSERDFVKKHLPSESVNVTAFLVPKFRMNFGFEATELLKGRGLNLLFSGGLTEMAVGGDFHVSNLFHESFIEVNEEGTEAAAASAFVEACMCDFKVDTLDFVADHPFLFVVREAVSGVLIFIGQVTDPRC